MPVDFEARWQRGRDIDGGTWDRWVFVMKPPAVPPEGKEAGHRTSTRLVPEQGDDAGGDRKRRKSRPRRG
jgi:hypothetical protein